MTTRIPFIGGNWKMNGDLATLSDLTRNINTTLDAKSKTEVVVFPSFVYLPAIKKLLGNNTIALGAQNFCQHEQGAYTGEIAASMLKDIGCAHVLVGHSERRQLYGETDQVVAEKCVLALKHDLKPVLCVGETLAQRQSDDAESTVLAQLDAVLDQINMDDLQHLVIAYEPVWAIGTGQTASAEQAQAMHQCLRQHLRNKDNHLGEMIRIIYGGSVKPANAAAIFAMPDIDGGLIGGASLNADDFVAIVNAV
ncbi:MAG: triose-phosphate isomerase [Pseudomonadota bacterium]